jgi:hypothetical protein
LSEDENMRSEMSMEWVRRAGDYRVLIGKRDRLGYALGAVEQARLDELSRFFANDANRRRLPWAHREQIRAPISMIVQFGSAVGQARDISPQGMFVATTRAPTTTSRPRSSSGSSRRRWCASRAAAWGCGSSAFRCRCASRTVGRGATRRFSGPRRQVFAANLVSLGGGRGAGSTCPAGRLYPAHPDTNAILQGDSAAYPLCAFLAKTLAAAFFLHIFDRNKPPSS